MRKLTSFIAFLLLTATVWAQAIEEEIGFKYVKAEYLLNTQRYDDAVKELNDIIKQSPTYKNALILRGETKYKLAAYKGAKLDAMQSIELLGITPDAASILGRSEYALGNFDAALPSLSAAIAMGLTDEKLFLERAEIYQKQGLLNKACLDWNEAARNGSTTAAINSRKFCPNIPEVVKQDPPRNEPPATDVTTVEENTINDSSQVSGPSSETDLTENTGDNPLPDPSLNEAGNGQESNSGSNLLIPEDNNTPNEIVIDEDLTLAIVGQGLGLRRVLERPSILILSEEDGVVAVEICVNENGRVEYAEYDAARSTLDTKSLVSLAVRKATEFWFERNEYPKQCGFIYFKIKGS